MTYVFFKEISLKIAIKMSKCVGRGNKHLLFPQIMCTLSPPRRPYFDIVVGLARSYDPESYAGGSLLLVGSPMLDRSKVMTQAKRDVLALQVGGR